MPEDILVVEYEPRYTDRVRQALNGQPFTPHFAKDGEEALRALSAADPRLIVLSSVIPKISTNELIRKIRASSNHTATPILITVSGYSGKSTVADAGKVGANDILPKPYSEAEFLGKVKELLSSKPVGWDAPLDGDFQARPVSTTAEQGGLTSSEIFGDLLDEEKAPARKAGKTSGDDLDKLLSDTLSGLRPARPKPAPPAAAPAAPPVAKKPEDAAKAASAAKASSDLDAFLDQTLSGLKRTVETPRVEPKPATPPAPVVTPSPAQKPEPQKTVAMPKPVVEPPKPVPAPTPAAPVSPASTQKIAPLTVATAPQTDEIEDSGDGQRFGQYMMQERIASGGMAEVWKARMRGVEGFQKVVAIKKILPHLSDDAEFVEMFVDEAKLAAQLNHNNIIHIYDLGKVATSYYIAMEYIDGHDLKSILRRGAERGNPMPVELALLIGSKLAAALDYAHRKRDFEEKEMGLVHRDVSPQNVLISYEGDIKLCDFGIAKAASKASHTLAGALKGKLQYMSPEQAWGKKIDRRSDIFGLATVLFELLTGTKLFTGDSEMSVLEQVRDARVVAPSTINDEVAPEVDKIVMKALAKEPGDRYQTAGEMAKDLDQVLYTFRPTPASADLAIYMHRLYTEDEPVIQAPAAPRLVEEPRSQRENLLAVPDVIEIPSIASEMKDEAPVRPAPVAPVIAAPVAAFAASEAAATESPRMFGAAADESEKKKLPIVPIAAALLVLLAIGGWLAFRGKGDAPAATAAANTSTAAVVATTSAAPVETEVVTASPSGSTIAPTDTVLASNDQALIDQEVQKRLAAEKAKLDRAQQVAAQQAAAQSQSQTPASTAQAPTTPQPTPQAPAPTATVAETRPEPPPQVITETSAPAQKAAVREGDLVDPGVAGLVQPELIRMKEPSYPPIAKARRIQGEVLLNALVSETGKVLEVRVIRSVSPDLGFGAAAADAVRGASFRAATKDGVRVKTYKTIKVSFKL